MDQLIVVQVSDFHMSESLDAPILNRGSGLRGHDPQLCRKLATEVRFISAKYRVSPDSLRWIVNGDLSRTGLHTEFATVSEFLELKPEIGHGRRPPRPTLGIEPSRYETVPGNHDHWNGWDSDSIRRWWYDPPPAWNPAIFPDPFQPTAWSSHVSPWISAGGGIQSAPDRP